MSLVFTPEGTPASPQEGEVYYDSTADKLKVRDASGFREVVSKNSSGEIDGTFSGSLPTFVGMIAPFAMSTPPTGWLACDGSNNVSKTVYADLYNALTANETISNPWGSGADSNTFALPDLEGAFLRGTGSHNTSNMSNGSDFTGPSVGSFENDMFQGHAHNLYSKGGYGNSDQIVALRNAVSGVGVYAIAERQNLVRGAVQYNYNSPRIGAETRPFNAGVKYCIKF